MSALPSAEWLEARRGGIGGSDVSAIVGENRRKTAIDVYLAKIGEHPEDLSDEDPEPGPFKPREAGHRLEPVVVDWVCEERGLRSGRFLAPARHPVHDWAIANPDRYVYEGDLDGMTLEELDGWPPQLTDVAGVLEAKAPGFWQRGDWDDDKVPVHALLQAQWYLFVLGWRWAVVGGLVGGQWLHHQRVERHDELIAMLVERCGEFWHENVAKRRPPTATALDTRIMEAAYDLTPGSVKTLADLPPDVGIEVVELVLHYRRLRGLIGRLEDSKAQTQARLQELLGQHDAEVIKWQPDPDRLREKTLVSWKRKHSIRVDIKALREERPEWAREFERESDSRSIYVTTVKDLEL